MVKRLKMVITLICVMLCCFLTACGAGLDAAAYMQAMMDVSYKNDTAAYVDMELGTQEQAHALFESGIDTEMSYFKERLDMSEQLEADFRSLFKDIYGKTKYTVGKAQKLDNGSYIVEITYERMKIFEPALTLYNKNIEALPAKWAAMDETPTSEEMLEDMTEVLRDALKKSLNEVEYYPQEALTVTIELVENVYTPNSQDVIKLEKALFDSDYSLKEAQ